MTRPHAASIVEDALNRRLDMALRRRGWRTRIIAHTGYGSDSFVRVLGRVLLSRASDGAAPTDSAAPTDNEVDGHDLRHDGDVRRGWRAFLTAPAMDVPIRIRVNGRNLDASTDRAGLIDVTLNDHGLEPGWHTVTISSPDADDATAEVVIVGPDVTFGLISDIDDTVIKTSLPRPMIAAWNTFVRNESTRHVVPGMATMYRTLLDENPGAPVVYVSTGAWNTAPALTRFLRRNGYPVGPLLLTDWGPTNTGWFRSGQDHKRSCLHRLARELPHIKWVLVGDDGQHDPRLYGDFVDERPEVVSAIAIRELSAAEQVLSHGIPVSNEEFSQRLKHQEGVPVCRAPNGYGLLRLLRVALGKEPAP